MNYNKSTKISVIGSNGGIGAAIIDELISQGFIDVLGITISGKEKWGRNLRVIKTDALDQNQLIQATKGSEIIFGAFNASEYTDKSWGEEFPVFMDNFVECGRVHGAKLIFLDNVYSYENQESKNPYNESTAIVPYNTKGKIREVVAKKFLYGLKKCNLSGNIIKSSDLYGPYSLNSVIGDRYFKALFEKNVAEILPLGNNEHSLTYTRDVGKIALITALDDKQPLVIHTPNAPAKGYQDMVKMTYKHNDISANPKESYSPMFMFYILALFIPPIKSMLGMMYQWNNKFVIDTLYNTDFVPTTLDQGIQETVEWFSKNKEKIK
jgi:nucleoside-diphosphate-sugar epimerase